MEELALVLAASAANVAGGFVIFIKKSWSERAMHALMAFSAGLLLSVTLADLLPEVYADGGESSAIYVLASIAVMFVLQQVIAPHTHFDGGTPSPNRSGTITGLMTAMSLHTFFDGFSIIASFQLNAALGLVVFAAIFLHKIPDGVTIASIVFSFSKDKKRAVYCSALLGLMTLVGGFAAWMLTGVYFPNEHVLMSALSVSAGIFLYVAGVELLPEIHATGDRRLGLYLAAGIAVYFIVHGVLAQFSSNMHI
ncbi:MAG TPA: ZIP family metal transporter [Bacillales bacterium]|nr:ZIP family metal transporter [Bacillales bacterium]